MTLDEGKRSARPPTLDEMNLAPGKEARLRDMMYGHGVGNGTLLLLPIDHGLDRGPRDFFPNPAAADPRFQLELATRGGYNGLACQIGIAEKFFPDCAGRVPLVLKISGKTNVPPDDAAHSPLNATVEDTVRLGAHAVGYTLYVGSPLQSRHHGDLRRVRRECERYGMPSIVWAHPRGSAIESKGGRDSIYAVDYAARLAMEAGASGLTFGRDMWQRPMDEALEATARVKELFAAVPVG